MERIKKVEKIQDYQHQLEEKLRDSSDGTRKDVTVGYLYGNWDVEELYYWKNLKLWYYSGKLENRYRNAFGIKEKKSDKDKYSIDVQINIPVGEIDKNIAGRFAKDNQGEVWICHNGTIGGGQEGFGKHNFWDKYENREKIAKADGEKVVKVGKLNSENLVKDIYDFVKEVKNIKESIKEK